MSYQRMQRAEDVRIRAVDRERNPEGTNGIGKAFVLRPQVDWRAMLAFRYDNRGKLIGGRA